MTSTHVLAEYGLDGMPLAAALLSLVGIVLARSHLTYWAGRGVSRGARPAAARGGRAWRSVTERAARLASTPSARRGVAIVHRWGPLAVTLAYLTVGVQTAVFLGAGLVRMPYARFTLASLPGAVAWAAIWGTVGIGAVWGALALAAGSRTGLVTLLAAALVVTALTVVAVRRRRGAEPHLARPGGPAAPSRD